MLFFIKNATPPCYTHQTPNPHFTKHPITHPTTLRGTPKLQLSTLQSASQTQFPALQIIPPKSQLSTLQNAQKHQKCKVPLYKMLKNTTFVKRNPLLLSQKT